MSEQTKPAEYQEGDLEKFMGVDPDFTGKMSTEEYVDSVRGGSRDSEIANLEWRVVEAAVAFHAEGPLDSGPDDGYSTDVAGEAAQSKLMGAVDALIAAREKVEKGEGRIGEGSRPLKST